MISEELANLLEELEIETVEELAEYVEAQIGAAMDDVTTGISAICAFCGGNLIEGQITGEYGRIIRMKTCEDCQVISEWWDGDQG
jgi:hypothetical protein